MSPEHADLEADWLGAELARSAKYAREAYDSKLAEPTRQLALANLIGTLDTLAAHYAPPEGVEIEDKPQYVPAPRHKQRGFWGRMFLGDN